MEDAPRIVVVGLGYVGLPLALALARSFQVVGFDSDASRIEALLNGVDWTGEVEARALEETTLEFAARDEAITGADFYIVAVPTPVDEANKPDLGILKAATVTVGRRLAKGSVVVFESTVYPGVTEDVCGPILARESGLTRGVDFHLGYSPERINPGDPVHTVDRITKIVAGETPEIADRLMEIYGMVNGGEIFVATDIRTAEAAKVIENAQRDINIAFMNEITRIFGALDISIYDVLEAAGTKWNFLPFGPGLVGGHCIGVDPYYLAHVAEAAGVDPAIVLSGRQINDSMAEYLAGRIAAALPSPSHILVLGLTFKENVPDLRNTKVMDLIDVLKDRGHTVSVHDPLADPKEAKALFDIDLLPEASGTFDCVVGCVAHAGYETHDLDRLLAEGGLIADIKGIWRGLPCPEGLRYLTL